jgi:hypothetical protein
MEFKWSLFYITLSNIFMFMGSVGKYFIHLENVVDIGKNSHIYKVWLELNHFKQLFTF